MPKRDVTREIGAELEKLIQAGFIDPPVGASFPLENAADALNLIDGRGATGKVVRSFMAYAPTFTGGVFVAVGDVNGDGRADGKSVWDLMMLVVLPETEVVVEVEGEDAAAAITALADILASPGGEDYTI